MAISKTTFDEAFRLLKIGDKETYGIKKSGESDEIFCFGKDAIAFCDEQSSALVNPETALVESVELKFDRDDGMFSRFVFIMETLGEPEEKPTPKLGRGI